MEILFLLGLGYPVVVILTIIALTKNWQRSIRNEFRNDDDLNPWMILLGILFTTLAPAIGFMRFDVYGPEIPFSKHHVLAIELLVVVSAVCYWISKFYKKKLPPFVNLLLRAGLIQGIVLDAIVTIHFANYLGMGIIFPLFGFELLAPPVAMFFLLYELQCNARIAKQFTEPAFTAEKKVLLQAGVVVALIVVQQIVLLPAGFHWDSLVSAFTESKGFVFSSGSQFNF